MEYPIEKLMQTRALLTHIKKKNFKVRPTPHTNPKTLLERSSSKLSAKSVNQEKMRSSPSDDPPPTKKHSEYAQLSDFSEALNKEHDNSTG